MPKIILGNRASTLNRISGISSSSESASNSRDDSDCSSSDQLSLSDDNGASQQTRGSGASALERLLPMIRDLREDLSDLQQSFKEIKTVFDQVVPVIKHYISAQPQAIIASSSEGTRESRTASLNPGQEKTGAAVLQNVSGKEVFNRQGDIKRTPVSSSMYNRHPSHFVITSCLHKPSASSADNNSEVQHEPSGNGLPSGCVFMCPVSARSSYDGIIEGRSVTSDLLADCVTFSWTVGLKKCQHGEFRVKCASSTEGIIPPPDNDFSFDHDGRGIVSISLLCAIKGPIKFEECRWEFVDRSGNVWPDAPVLIGCVRAVASTKCSCENANILQLLLAECNTDQNEPTSATNSNSFIKSKMAEEKSQGHGVSDGSMGKKSGRSVGDVTGCGVEIGLDCAASNFDSSDSSCLDPDLPTCFDLEKPYEASGAQVDCAANCDVTKDGKETDDCDNATSWQMITATEATCSMDVVEFSHAATDENFASSSQKSLPSILSAMQPGPSSSMAADSVTEVPFFNRTSSASIALPSGIPPTYHSGTNHLTQSNEDSSVMKNSAVCGPSYDAIPMSSASEQPTNLPELVQQNCDYIPPPYPMMGSFAYPNQINPISNHSASGNDFPLKPSIPGVAASIATAYGSVGHPYPPPYPVSSVESPHFGNSYGGNAIYQSIISHSNYPRYYQSLTAPVLSSMGQFWPVNAHNHATERNIALQQNTIQGPNVVPGFHQMGGSHHPILASGVQQPFTIISGMHNGRNGMEVGSSSACCARPGSPKSSNSCPLWHAPCNVVGPQQNHCVHPLPYPSGLPGFTPSSSNLFAKTRPAKYPPTPPVAEASAVGANRFGTGSTMELPSGWSSNNRLVCRHRSLPHRMGANSRISIKQSNPFAQSSLQQQTLPAVPPKPAARPVGGEKLSNLLTEMGFEDDELNEILLSHYDGNVDLVIRKLLDMQVGD